MHAPCGSSLPQKATAPPHARRLRQTRNATPSPPAPAIALQHLQKRHPSSSNNQNPNPPPAPSKPKPQGYLFHCLLGHAVEPATLRVQPPAGGLSAPNLPELNHSQLQAVGWGGLGGTGGPRRAAAGRRGARRLSWGGKEPANQSKPRQTNTSTDRTRTNQTKPTPLRRCAPCCSSR